MSYSVEADLNLSAARLVELTESDSAVGVKDSTLIALLHERATDRINASLYGKYVIDPLDFPPILTEIEADIWRFLIYSHREVMEIPKTVQDDYDWADGLLERYRTGEEALPVAHTTAASGPTPSGGAFNFDATAEPNTPVFGRSKDGL